MFSFHNFKCIFNLIQKRMTHTFAQKFNPFSGKMEWQLQVTDYDYEQGIARSGYADMVNDIDRNQLYHAAIKKSIHKLMQEGKQVHALDIGTGTGLLAMMCAKSGASKVTACECFTPMAGCAKEIIKHNGLDKTITVIPKRSDEIVFGDVNQSDMKDKANLLVTELFDTELIGEGALHAYRHAIKNLIKADSLAVPARARVYAQLVESKDIFKWNQFASEMKWQSKSDKTIHSIIASEDTLNCPGSNILHDLQLNQLTPNRDFKIISQPEVIFEFDFTDHESLSLSDHKEVKFKLIEDVDGPVVVFMWWDLMMDYEGEFLLSCAPYWTYSDQSAKTLPWRDHWMQAVYYLPAYKSCINKLTGQVLNIEAHHDDYSLWFDVKSGQENGISSSPYMCKCGLHSHVSRTRLGLLNDEKRLMLYQESLNYYLSEQDLTVLFIGDSSLIPILAAKMNKIKKVICLTKESYDKRFINEFAIANECVDKIELISNIEDVNQEMNVIISEPYFNSTDLPWHHLHFWYLISTIKINHSHLITDKTKIMPNRALIKALPIQFDHLWKIRSQVGCDVEGFDLRFFDDMISKSISLSDDCIESQPLWEYPGTAIGDVNTLFDFDLTQTISQTTSNFNTEWDINLDMSSIRVNPSDENQTHISIAFWLDLYLTDEISVSSGSIGDIRTGDYVDWERNYRQGVAFLPGININDINSLRLVVTFDISNGQIKFAINNDSSKS